MASLGSHGDGDGDTETPVKKRSLGASDRVSLDVGGIQFVSSASTLASNSSYFASLLSENWNVTYGDREIFLDQDPNAFAKILAYMRRGLINVEEIDAGVLTLAEFLGVERLLVAVKVRSYQNLGFDPDLSGEDEGTIAAAFDHQHGGIMKALNAGILPRALVQEERVKKDFAILKFLERGDDHVVIHLESQQTQQPDSEFAGIISALNWLYRNGYTEHENQMDIKDSHDLIWTFSRKRRHSVCSNESEVFIPTNLDTMERRERKWRKQFALVLHDTSRVGKLIHAPSEFHEDSGRNADPLAVAIIETGEVEDGSWLERHDFVSREEGLERVFEYPMNKLLWDTFHRPMNVRIPNPPHRIEEQKKGWSYRIYSRRISCSEQEI